MDEYKPNSHKYNEKLKRERQKHQKSGTRHSKD